MVCSKPIILRELEKHESTCCGIVEEPKNQNLGAFGYSEVPRTSKVRNGPSDEAGRRHEMIRKEIMKEEQKEPTKKMGSLGEVVMPKMERRTQEGFRNEKKKIEAFGGERIAGLNEEAKETHKKIWKKPEDLGYFVNWLNVDKGVVWDRLHGEKTREIAKGTAHGAPQLHENLGKKEVKPPSSVGASRSGRSNTYVSGVGSGSSSISGLNKPKPKEATGAHGVLGKIHQEPEAKEAKRPSNGPRATLGQNTSKVGDNPVRA